MDNDSWVTTSSGAAHRSGTNSTEEVETDADGVWVRAERGSGYMRESFDVFIPSRVLRHCLSLLEETGE